MTPFDLDQFDEMNERGGTAEAVEGIARRFLGRSGMEREGAALVSSRLYMRYVSDGFRIALLLNTAFRADTKDRLGGFLTWGEEKIMGSTDLFLESPFSHPVLKFLTSPFADDRDIASGLRNHQSCTFKYIPNSFIKVVRSCKICG